MIQVNSMASKKISNILKCLFLPTDVIHRSIVSVGRSGYIKVTVRNHFIIVSFLFQEEQNQEAVVGINSQACFEFYFILKPILWIKNFTDQACNPAGVVRNNLPSTEQMLFEVACPLSQRSQKSKSERNKCHKNSTAK